MRAGPGFSINSIAGTKILPLIFCALLAIISLARADTSQSIVQNATQRNLALDAELSTVSGETEHLNARLRHATETYDLNRRGFELTKEQLGFEGFGAGMGEVLRQERRTLPPPEEYRRRVADLRNDINEHRLEQMRLEQERRATGDVDQAVAAAMKGNEQAPDATELRTIFQERRKLFDRLREAYTTYLAAATKLAQQEQELADQTTAYAKLLDERLLWIPNASAVGRNWLPDLAGSFAWFCDPSAWQRSITLLLERMLDAPVLSLLVVTFFFALLLFRRQLIRRMDLLSSRVREGYSDRFFLTTRAFLVTILLVIPCPLLLWFAGLEMGAAGATDLFAAAIAAGLRGAGTMLFILLFLRRICLDENLAHVHFHWAQRTRRVLYRNFTWLGAAYLPVMFIVAATESTGIETYSEGLGRLAFVIGAIALAIFAQRLLRPRGGALDVLLESYHGRRIYRYRYGWYLIGVAIPVVFCGLSLVGYYYAALAIETRLFRTLTLIAAAVLAYNLVVRWLILAQHRVATHQARERHEAVQAARACKEAADAAGMASPQTLEVPQIEMAAVSIQTRALLRFVVGLLVVIGLWIIWAGIIPALSIFNDVVLWQYTASVNGQARLVPITLANLGLSLLIILLTIVSVRNVAGILEIALLQRLSPDAGLRYAISRVSRYLIVTVGIVAAFNAIGIGWSQVQWLVAAVGVGLGFGLQEIFANFVSGLIVLFERPIRVGDFVTIGDFSGTVSRIRMRATTLNDADNREVIVPNKIFITDRLVNWTLSDTITRLVIKVSIAYGSDLALAQKLMMEVAAANPLVMSDPAPTVFLVNFSECALDFEMRVFVREPVSRAPVASNLHVAIVEALKKNGIDIPFPQRDVRIVSLETPHNSSRLIPGVRDGEG